MRAIAIAAVMATAAGFAAAPRADVLAVLAEGGAALEPLGAAGGLAGWRVTPADGAPYTLYVAESGHAVVGLLYDAAGALVTADQIAAAADPPPATTSPAPPAATSAQREADVVQSVPLDGGFVLGSQGPHLRLFADPACPWSRTTAAELAAAALDGRLVLEVVPVALMGAESARMALAAVAGGAEAWFSHAAADPHPSTSAAVRENNARFAESGGAAVPHLVWQDATGATRTLSGMPASVDALLAELDG